MVLKKVREWKHKERKKEGKRNRGGNGKGIAGEAGKRKGRDGVEED